jgi:hypothetical protein
MLLNYFQLFSLLGIKSIFGTLRQMKYLRDMTTQRPRCCSICLISNFPSCHRRDTVRYKGYGVGSKILYRSATEQVPIKDYELPLGKADVLVAVDDVTLIGRGTQVSDGFK